MFWGREITRQALTFIVVGLASTSLNYLIFISLISYSELHYLLCASLGFIGGLAFGYAFNKIETFRSSKPMQSTLPRYFLVYLFNLGYNLFFLELLVREGISAIYANIILMPLVVILNFFGTKLIAFENRRW